MNHVNYIYRAISDNYNFVNFKDPNAAMGDQNYFIHLIETIED